MFENLVFEFIFGVGVGGIELFRIFGDNVGVAKYLEARSEELESFQ